MIQLVDWSENIKNFRIFSENFKENISKKSKSGKILREFTKFLKNYFRIIHRTQIESFLLKIHNIFYV